jgi:hypothetical protein
MWEKTEEKVSQPLSWLFLLLSFLQFLFKLWEMVIHPTNTDSKALLHKWVNFSSTRISFVEEEKDKISVIWIRRAMMPTSNTLMKGFIMRKIWDTNGMHSVNNDDFVSSFTSFAKDMASSPSCSLQPSLFCPPKNDDTLCDGRNNASVCVCSSQYSKRVWIIFG